MDTERAKWHVCPCCVGNIPRTLLMLPTWAYAKSDDGLYVNMFVGSTINVGDVAGTPVEMVQETDYPWHGKVAITVNPKQSRRFALRLRVPDRKTSALYQSEPAVSGLVSLSVNGTPVTPRIERGYAVITREWRAGDRVELELPLRVQRVTGDERIEATRGKVALRYGPLVYNVERADQPRIDLAIGAAGLSPAWRGDLLGGVMTIVGEWNDGSRLTAIPQLRAHEPHRAAACRAADRGCVGRLRAGNRRGGAADRGSGDPARFSAVAGLDPGWRVGGVVVTVSDTGAT
ncbi:MAG: glycoside hydrolase family 127 protein [Sphingomonas phyllosphaerae]